MKFKEIFVERITSGLNLWQKEFQSHDAILTHDPLPIEDHSDPTDGCRKVIYRALNEWVLYQDSVQGIPSNPHHPSILSLLFGSLKLWVIQS